MVVMGLVVVVRFVVVAVFVWLVLVMTVMMVVLVVIMFGPVVCRGFRGCLGWLIILLLFGLVTLRLVLNRLLGLVGRLFGRVVILLLLLPSDFDALLVDAVLAAFLWFPICGLDLLEAFHNSFLGLAELECNDIPLCAVGIHG